MPGIDRRMFLASGVAMAVGPVLAQTAMEPHHQPLSAFANFIGYPTNGVAVPFSASNTTTAPGGIWSWFNGPKIVEYNNSLYIGSVSQYQGRTQKITVTRQNILENSIQVSSTAITLYEKNDHDDPGLLILPDGRLLVAASMHNGSAYVTWTTQSLNLDPNATSFETPTVFNGATQLYSFVYLATSTEGVNGYRIYWFFRVKVKSRFYRFSDDFGNTWSADIEVIKNATGRPYIQVFQFSPDRFDILCTDDHPNEVLRNNVYHCYFQNGSFFKTDGTLITAPLPFAPSSMTLVYNALANDETAWIWDLKFDFDDNPMCAIQTQNGIRLRGTGLPTGPQISFVSVIDSGGVVTVTTTAKHNFVVGDKVRFKNLTTIYNDKTFAVLSTPSNTTFTFASIGAGNATPTGESFVAILAPHIEYQMVRWNGAHWVPEYIADGIEPVAVLNDATAIEPSYGAGIGILDDSTVYFGSGRYGKQKLYRADKINDVWESRLVNGNSNVAGEANARPYCPVGNNVVKCLWWSANYVYWNIYSNAQIRFTV